MPDKPATEPAPKDRPTRQRIEIFRATEGTNLNMPQEGVTRVDEVGLSEAYGAGLGEGSVVKMLFSDPRSGMSLSYAWFKSNYMLLRHSHDADCVYYVISGEVHLGTEILQAGDVFFVPANQLYQYSAGQKGVEILEFRNADDFNIRFSGNSATIWRRIGAVAAANLAVWRTEMAPPAAARMPR
jgi:mannose-6-phosphate isomerase-like protein (cupin superfamily)